MSLAPYLSFLLQLIFRLPPGLKINIWYWAGYRPMPVISPKPNASWVTINSPHKIVLFLEQLLLTSVIDLYGCEVALGLLSRTQLDVCCFTNEVCICQPRHCHHLQQFSLFIKCHSHWWKNPAVPQIDRVLPQTRYHFSQDDHARLQLVMNLQVIGQLF